MRPAHLLRWYPRAWRERYGEELLALIQDTLEEGRPTWWLRLGVIWGGLRERGRQAGHAAKAAVRRVPSEWPTIFVAGLLFTNLPQQLRTPVPPARAGQTTVALDVLVAVAAFTCVVVLAGGLAAWPAVLTFLRAGGWPKIRRRVAWAAGATGPTLGALVALSFTLHLQASAPLNVSLGYFLGFIAGGVALVITFGLWTAAVAATARHLKLTPRVRALELVAGPVITTAVSVMVSVSNVWLSAAQASVFYLVAGIGLLIMVGATAPWRIRQAIRKGRRLRAAAAGK
jgi:hypothetical protein